MLNKKTIDPTKVVYLYKEDRLRAMQMLEERRDEDGLSRCLLESIPPRGVVVLAKVFDPVNRHALPIDEVAYSCKCPFTDARAQLGF